MGTHLQGCIVEKMVAMALGWKNRCGLRARVKNMGVFDVKGLALSVGLLFFPGSSTAPAPWPGPSPLCPQNTPASDYSLARMTMSMPQKMLMIQPTITMAVST